MGTSDAWSMICLSHRPGEPAYYIVDWQILTFNRWYLFDFTKMEGTQMEMFNFLWLI
jgi:hypothetical protein